MDLLSAWQKWDADSPPYILKADADVLKSSDDVVTYRSYDASKSHDFSQKDKKLHLGLLPGPFMGDMLNASIYVLTLNPGLDKYDYYGDYEMPAFRQALLANLKQECLERVLPFTFLNPQFDWHGGFKYWRSRSKKVIQALADRRRVRYEVARSELGKKFAVIELFPYHSAEFNDKWLSCLPSVRLAGEFVRDTVVKRIREKQAICIAVRGVKYWDQYLDGLTEEQGVKRYYGGQCRAASLTSAKDMILSHLGVTTQSK